MSSLIENVEPSTLIDMREIELEVLNSEYLILFNHFEYQ